MDIKEVQLNFYQIKRIILLKINVNVTIAQLNSHREILRQIFQQKLHEALNEENTKLFANQPHQQKEKRQASDSLSEKYQIFQHNDEGKGSRTIILEIGDYLSSLEKESQEVILEKNPRKLEVYQALRHFLCIYDDFLMILKKQEKQFNKKIKQVTVFQPLQGSLQINSASKDKIQRLRKRMDAISTTIPHSQQKINYLSNIIWLQLKERIRQLKNHQGNNALIKLHPYDNSDLQILLFLIKNSLFNFKDLQNDFQMEFRQQNYSKYYYNLMYTVIKNRPNCFKDAKMHRNLPDYQILHQFYRDYLQRRQSSNQLLILLEIQRFLNASYISGIQQIMKIIRNIKNNHWIHFYQIFLNNFLVNTQEKTTIMNYLTDDEQFINQTIDLVDLLQRIYQKFRNDNLYEDKIESYCLNHIKKLENALQNFKIKKATGSLNSSRIISLFTLSKKLEKRLYQGFARHIMKNLKDTLSQILQKSYQKLRHQYKQLDAEHKNLLKPFMSQFGYKNFSEDDGENLRNRINQLDDL